MPLSDDFPLLFCTAVQSLKHTAFQEQIDPTAERDKFSAPPIYSMKLKTCNKFQAKISAGTQEMRVIRECFQEGSLRLH